MSGCRPIVFPQYTKHVPLSKSCDSDNTHRAEPGDVFAETRSDMGVRGQLSVIL